MARQKINLRLPLSLAAVTFEGRVRSFADIPQEIGRRVGRGEGVVLIVLDAVGLELLERQRRHPLLRRLEIEPLRSQLPSTTTAHMTTLHFALPVDEHGLYEWEILEPSLGELICPLRFSRAGSPVAGDLAGRLDPVDLAPGPTLYERLGAPSLVAHPRGIARTPYTRMATRGALGQPFEDLEHGVRLALEAAAGGGYGLVYWDAVDTAGHRYGPDSPQVALAVRRALDAVHRATLGPPGPRGRAQPVTVLLSADHGQLPVSPARVDYLDELWPELPRRMRHPRPAGSSRAVFLHVHDPQAVIVELSARLGSRARVLAARELFRAPGPRLLARLGEVAVLPAPGRQAWLRRTPGPEGWVRGHHGGATEAETAVYLARLSA